MMKAAEVLDAVQHKYSDAAIVRELTTRDQDELALYYRWQIDRHPTWAHIYDRPGIRVAEPGSIPEGWSPFSVPTTRRIDGLMLEAQRFTALEVKISRADFRRETPEKRRTWQCMTNRFIYVTPAGLLRPDEIPAGCGLWEVAETGTVSVAKRATVNKTPAPIPDSTWRTVFYRLATAERKNR